MVMYYVLYIYIYDVLTCGPSVKAVEGTDFVHSSSELCRCREKALVVCKLFFSAAQLVRYWTYSQGS